MMKKIILSVFFVFTVVATAFAEEATPILQPAVTHKAENEIPLNINQEKAAQAGGSQSSKLFLTLIVLAGMGGAGFYFARKYAVSNKINKSNMQIKVLSQHHLGAKKSLAIIRVAGESILIGVTDQNISMIKSLSLIDDEVPAEMPQSFAQTLEGSSKAQSTEEMAAEIHDDFSFAGIKSDVSQKLKSMRNFQ